MIGIKRVSGLLCGLACLLALAFCACESAVPDNCGDGSRLNPATEFCYGGQAYPKCGGGEYDPTVKKCENGILKNKCGVYYYDTATQFCAVDTVYSKCGGQIYVPATTTCENNVPKAPCGNGYYNPATEICNGGIVAPVTYTLTVSADPAGSGSVSRDPDKETYNAGTLVTVTATAAAGYAFTGWSGASTATANVVQITMDANKTLTARFQMPAAGEKYKVTFSVNGGSGTAPSDILVNAGYSATLPSGNNLSRSGYSFGGWNTESSGTGTNYAAGSSYYPTANITLYAKWTPPSTPVAFIDSRDGNSYKGIAIGTQVWMVENLNYDATGSKCYNNSVDSCEKYGRLYSWTTAMGGASSSDDVPSGVQGVCPAGWHLPSDAEWDTLINFAGGSSTAGKKLKSTRGWGAGNGNGTDEYGFSALPGGYGYGYSGGGFEFAVTRGYWWSATAISSNAYGRYMYGSDGNVGRNNFEKTYLYSVRCVEN